MIRFDYWLIGILLFLSGNVALRASETAARCGDIVEGEFTRKGERHKYHLDLEPGAQFTFKFVPVGDFLKLAVVEIIEPSGQQVFRDCCHLSNPYDYVSGTLSARGRYSVVLGNRNAGVYTLHIGCIGRDGTAISPGQKTENTSPATKTQPAAIPLKRNFRGFAGLRPIDFSGMAFPKLQLGTQVAGKITSGSGEVFGFLFDGSQGNVVDLSFHKSDGQLGVALVILGPGDHLVFQATLLDSLSLSSRLTLPKEGTYTLAVAQQDQTQGSIIFNVQITSIVGPDTSR